MLKHIKRLLKANILLIAISVTIAIVYLSLMRVPKMNYQITHSDKFQHAFAYFVLSLSWFLLFRNSKPKIKYIIVLSCILFGIVIEVLQATLTMYRTGDYLDSIANTVGVVLAFIFFNYFFKKKRVK